MPMAMATVMMRCHVAVTSPIWTPLVSRKNCGMVRPVVGFQMVSVMPMKASIRPTVTMSWTTSAASRRRRMISRSRPRPMSGATTRRTTASDTGTGQPQSTLNCQ